MRVLHLYSDFRWTGPAEPVADLVRRLREQGWDVSLACRRRPDRGKSHTFAERAAEIGVEPRREFYINRHCPPQEIISDLLRLPRRLDRERIDILHTHLEHDHVIGALAARLAKRRVIVVRTNHTGSPIKPNPVRRLIFGKLTDACLGFSASAAEADARALNLDPQRMYVTNPVLDMDRFTPRPARADLRSELGAENDSVLGGIAARLQRHRRFPILMEALHRARRQAPRLRFTVIGRSRAWRESVEEPIKRFGLSDIVHRAGYRREDYVDCLAALDFKVFLVPGSDGTCRAAREALAMGKPVIAARRGMLSELVPHDHAGLIVDDSPEQLAEAIARMATDDALRRRLADNARPWAERTFRSDTQTRDVGAMYERLMSLNAKRRGVATAP